MTGMVGLLIAARDGKRFKRGDVAGIRPPSAGWGSMECLPNYVRINISDLTTYEHFKTVQEYEKTWVVDYTREYLGNQAGDKKRFLIKVDPQYVSASGNTKKDMKGKFETWFLVARADPESIWYDCNIVSYDGQNNGVILDIPSQANMQALQEEFTDYMKEVFEHARFKLVGGALSTIEASGGEVTVTKAEAKTYLRDKLLD